MHTRHTCAQKIHVHKHTPLFKRNQQYYTCILRTIKHLFNSEKTAQVHGLHLEGDRGICPPPPNFYSEGDRISDAPPPPTLPPPPHTHTFLGWKKITYFNICILQSFLLDLSRPHVLTLYLHSDILSMYSIHRMRGNGNQSHKNLQMFYGVGGCSLSHQIFL